MRELDRARKRSDRRLVVVVSEIERAKTSVCKKLQSRTTSRRREVAKYRENVQNIVKFTEVFTKYAKIRMKARGKCHFCENSLANCKIAEDFS